ncbi:hypothetical protein [Microbacterium sp. SORGH_AS_0862]|uniref:hypothetical protein n=1 Tax=Microbacterium sp. SORGH_AS_0862 TaxID=3041789 RepID=UPI00278F8F90|nr:hypothetical protein [Microbacterium sp. SORGH_AS_0862]MDQ1206604.1 hypothetical protein [Microbacterium sp. SORGH_AS_0862]
MGSSVYHPSMDRPGVFGGKPPKKKQNSAAWGCFGCLGLVALFSAVIWGLASIGSGGDGYTMNNKFEAIAQCEAQIESQLKAPSTAKFNSEATGSGTWTVTGTVDAENSFGAMIRSSYQCTVVMDEAKDTARTRIDYFE